MLIQSFRQHNMASIYLYMSIMRMQNGKQGSFQGPGKEVQAGSKSEADGSGAGVFALLPLFLQNGTDVSGLEVEGGRTLSDKVS